ncbi:MAG: redoxin domain-containing protein [Verrucomicrobiota bacterium]
MITPGQTLNLDFRVKAVGPQGAGGVREVAFRELLSRRTIVSAHMKNNTPSCDRQVASLVEHAGEFAAAGYDIVAVSRDTSGSHLRYAAAKQVPFTLVSDPKDLWARAADSLVNKMMYGREFIGPARAAWVIEPDGRVLAVMEQVDTSDHAAQVREVIKSL